MTHGIEASVDWLEVERAIFAGAAAVGDSRPVFILGAPRTGSTLFYQLLIQGTGLPYLSNLTNACYAQHPVIGFSIQRHAHVAIDEKSRFGKTHGPFGPSEGSAVMMRWFGGGHPSQSVSAGIIPEQKAHFLATIAAVESIYGGRPLLIKNAWHCFRIECLASLLPGARFVWIRRDIGDAAESDLEARYLTKGAPDVWNSATPSNVEILRKLEPFQQVVENQYEFNRAIEAGLGKAAAGRYATLWYEDLLEDANGELARIGAFLGIDAMQAVDQARISTRTSRQVTASDAAGIKRYIASNTGRLASHCFRGREGK